MAARKGTPRPTKVLILSHQPLTAALLGMLLELEALEPAFARPGERPEDAFTRTRPLLVILLDGELETAHSDLFYARAAKRRAPVILFGTPDGQTDIERLARERGLRWFRMPIDRARLARIIEVVTDAGARGVAHAERRRAEVSRDEAGTLVYHDRAGRRWQVYDRRSPGVHTDRVFVGEAGEEWRFTLGDAAAEDDTAATLEWQLSRAELHRVPEP